MEHSMIENEQILELAKTCGFDSFTGEKDDGSQTDYWECWEEQLLKFALTIHEMGYNKGYDDGCSQASYPATGLFGEPQ
jgi:hypothetical protein